MTTRKAEHLTIDPPLTVDCRHTPSFAQNYALVSFISPENRIKQRFFYECERFLHHDVNKQMIDTTTSIVRDVNMEFHKLLSSKIETYKSSTDPIYQTAGELLSKTLDDFKMTEEQQVEKTMRLYQIGDDLLESRYESYKIANAAELEQGFNDKHGPETSIRGFKVRGVFTELGDAKKRAEHLQKQVEPFVHTFVAPVGYWCPFDPNADSVQDQEYMVEKLNEMMIELKRNAEQKDDFFQKRKQMMIDANAQEKDKERENELRKRLQKKLTEMSDDRRKK